MFGDDFLFDLDLDVELKWNSESFDLSKSYFGVTVFHSFFIWFIFKSFL